MIVLKQMKRCVNIVIIVHITLRMDFDDPQVCMVTEYAEGDLFQILEDDKTLPEPQVNVAYTIIQQIRNTCIIN